MMMLRFMTLSAAATLVLLFCTGCGAIDLFADLQLSREDANREVTSDVRPAAADVNSGLRLGEDDQGVAASRGDALGTAFIRHGDELSFLFTQLSDGDGLVLSAKHQADFYFAIDVSRTMGPSRESLIQNLSSSLAFLASQSFSAQAKIMKFSQLCWAKSFVSPPALASPEEYREYLKRHITEAMPQAGDAGWDCDVRHEKTNLPEMAFTAIDQILAHIKIEYKAAGSGVRRHPVLVVVSDNPSAARGYRRTRESFSEFTADYHKWAQEMGQRLAGFQFLDQLRFYASLGPDQYLQKQYQTVLAAAKAAQPPLVGGSAELAFPLSNRSFLELIGAITASAVQEAPLACLLMEAAASSAKKTTTWKTKAIKKSILKLGLVSWKHALRSHVYPITITEKRCCVAGGAGAPSLADLPTDDSTCKQVIQAKRVLKQG